MKRLVLRIVVLGVVVVLGVIAIAHAQRAAERSAISAEQLSQPSAASADAAQRPNLTSADRPVNPLRPAPRSDQAPPAMVQNPHVTPLGGAAAERMTPSAKSPTPSGEKILLTAGGGEAAPTENAAPNEHLAANATAPAKPSASLPEVRAARPADAPIAAAGEPAADADIPDARSVPGLTARGPAPADDNRYAQINPLLAPAQVSDSAAASADGEQPPAQRYAAAARGGGRYGMPPREGAEAEEPAPLKIDPFATPANSAGVARADHKAAADGNWPTAAAQSGVAAQPNLLPASTAVASRADAPSGAAADAAGAGEGSGRPGEKQLEGPQTPQLTIQKFAPAEVQVGKPAAFRVLVRNTGSVPASSVEVHDQIPKGARVVNTTPQASRGVRGELVWTIGTIKPNDEAAVEMQIMPVSEGEIGSVATVVFNADASARCVATRPQLLVQAAAPEKVLIGDPLTLAITVSNPGTGVATGVVIEEHIPAGLQQPDHPGESGLEYEVGELRPGETRKLELTLTAKQAGPLTNVVLARGDGNLKVEGKCNLEVVAPQLDIALEGPKKRYLEREATYQVSLRNPGTAPAERVELVAYLPPGLKFVSANNSGHYDEANRAVCWRLDQLPVRGAGTVELVTLPIEPGQHNLKLLSTANKGLKVEKEQPVLIDGIAAILFQAASSVNPVEVGGETTCEIHVVNQGSKAATNVRLAVMLPPEMKPLSAEGPTRNAVEANRVLFDGLARLAPKSDTTYRVRMQALKPGDLRTRIQLMTDEMSSPITKEESTRVYADE